MRWYGRLRRSSEIAFVRRRGRRAAFAGFAVFAMPGPGPTRVCVSVSKAVGGAVTRNLVRRRIRGALDTLGAQGRAARLLFVAKPGAEAVPYERLVQDVARAVRLGGGV